jgi:hypothetical protein
MRPHLFKLTVSNFQSDQAKCKIISYPSSLFNIFISRWRCELSAPEKIECRQFAGHLCCAGCITEIFSQRANKSIPGSGGWWMDASTGCIVHLIAFFYGCAAKKATESADVARF